MRPVYNTWKLETKSIVRKVRDSNTGSWTKLSEGLATTQSSRMDSRRQKRQCYWVSGRKGPSAIVQMQLSANQWGNGTGIRL